MRAIGMYIFGGSQTIGHLNSGWDIDTILEMTESMPNDNAYHFIKNYPNIKVLKPSEWNNHLDNYKDYDLLFANPPCSGLSSINRNASVDSEINKHIYEVIDTIDKIQPKCFLIENAPTLTGLGLPILKDCIDKLKDNYRFTIINDLAGNHGVCMYRRRTFFIGWNKSEFTNNPIINFNKEEKVSMLDIIKGLNKDNYNMEAEYTDKYNYLYPKVPYKESLTLYIAENEPEIIDSIYVKTREKLKNNQRIFDKSPWKPDPKEQCMSLSSTAKVIHPIENRDLYIREYARIMGYPDNFIFYPKECNVPTIQALAQGVPAKFIEYISKEIKRCFSEKIGTLNDVVYINQSNKNRIIKNYSYEEFKNIKNIKGD